MSEVSTQQLRATEPFALLEDSELTAIAAQLELKTLAVGETLVEQGEVPGALYLLLDGHLSVSVRNEGDPERTLSKLGPGNIVGEVALVAGGRRSATVRASTDAHVAVLSTAAFSRLLDTHPAVATKFAELSSQRLREVQLATQMMEVFNGLTAHDLAELERAVEWVSLEAGQRLFEQGDPPDHAYIVVSGRLAIETCGSDGSVQHIGEVGHGENVVFLCY